MILRLFPDEFEQGYIHNIWNGANSAPNDGTSPSFHYSRIRTINKYVYNGDGENLYINITTTNNPTNLYCSISLYDIDGNWIDDDHVWLKSMTKVADNVFEYEITMSTQSFVSGLLGTTVGYFRLSFTSTTSSTPKESDYITPSIVNIMEAWSTEHWIMGNNGPELILAPEAKPAMSGSIASDYPYKLWRVNIRNNDGYPYNLLQRLTDKYDIPMTKPYPYSLWRIRENYNDGYPFNALHPGTKYVEPPVVYGDIDLLDKVHVISDPHGISDYFPVRKMEIPLNNIQDTRYTLSRSYRTSNSSLSRIINKL